VTANNWIDRLIAYFAPNAAASRLRGRLAVNAFEKALRSYEGASKGRRTSGWKTSGSSVNAENANALDILRSRSRDLIRNNPYAARAVGVIVSNTVGTGIAIQPTDDKSGVVRELWKAWGETKQCDADGRLNIYGLQALVLRTIVESGEVIIRRRRRLSSDPLDVPLQLQILEPDFLDHTKNGDVSGGGYIIQGVEFDALGRRIGYWLYDRHPGDVSTISKFSLQSKRIPAEDILHLYRMERSGQVRGVPWCAPVMLRLRDFDEYEDAQLVRQKIAACFTAFVQDMESPADAVTAKSNLGEMLEPGAIENLPPGKTVTLANPPGVTGYSEYSSCALHAIAAGMGVTYESMTGDLSQVNYSSGRMGWLEFHRNIESWRWLMMIPGFCEPIWSWFLEAAVLKAGKKVRVAPATHTPPAREMIDPTKEIPAARDAIRAGIKTVSETIREQGYDPKSHLEEYRQDMADLDQLGIVLDSDARKMSRAGTLQGAPNQGEPQSPEVKE
jgi:lambda family phage portal protein